MFVVYAIKSEVDDRIYVGFSEYFDRCFHEHNNGQVRSTKGFRPWRLIYAETVPTRESARQLEKKFKSGYGKEFLKSLK